MSALVGDSMALRSNRRDLAALLAIEAHRLAPNAESEAALFGTFTGSPGAERIVHTGLTMRSITSGDASYLPDGHTIVVGDELGAMHLLDMDTGTSEVLPALSDHGGWPVSAVAAQGRYVAAGWRELYEGESAVFTVWDLQTSEQRFPPVTVDFRIGDIAISDDGSTVAVSGGKEMRALIFDAATGAQRAEVETLEAPEGARNGIVTAELEFTPDGGLAVGSQAGVLRIVDPETGRERQRFEGPQESSHAFIGFVNGGREIVAAGEPFVRYDLATGERLMTSSRPPDEHSCNNFAAVERIGALLCGEWTGRVLAFDLETGAPLGALLNSQQGDVCGLAVSPDGTRVAEVAACTSEDVTIVEWRVDGGGPISRLALDTPNRTGVNQFGFRGTDALVADHVNEEGEWRTTVLDAIDGRQLASFEDVFGLVPTNDPRLAAVIYDDGETPPTFGSVRHPAPANRAGRSSIPASRWTNGGPTAAVAMVFEHASSVLRTFDLATGRRIEPTIDLPDRVWTASDLVFAADALYFVMEDQSDGGDRWLIQRRDRSTGAVLAETSGANYQKFAFNGGVAVAATLNGHVVELDPTTLEVVGAPFPGTNGAVFSLAIDDAGRRLLVRAADGSLRVLDIATRTQLGDPIDTGVVIGNATLRPDGLAAAAATDQGVVIWDLDPAHWVEAACELAGRNMTRQEWNRYLGDLADYHVTCPDHPPG